MESTYCRECLILLDSTNCAPSFLIRGFTICRKCNNEAGTEALAKNRRAAIERLGSACACCGINNYDLLSIDHINGGGAKDRNSFKKWKHYIKHLNILPINELKQKYRCLCYNCNYTRGFWGKCPHEFDNSISVDISNLPIIDRRISNTHLSESEQNIRGLILKRLRKLKIRLEMIMAYGGECIKCGEAAPMFLTIDHVHNNGFLTKNKGVGFYQELKTLGYPGKNTQLQLLCHNCNAQKEYISNRVNKSEQIKKEPEVYTTQEYKCSKTQEELWNEAKILYARINS